MIDAVMFGIVIIAIIALILILSYFFNSKDEDSFDKAFDGTTLALLHDNSKKDKKTQKSKAAKKTEKKKDESTAGKKVAENAQETPEETPSVANNEEKKSEKQAEVKKPKVEKKQVERKEGKKEEKSEEKLVEEKIEVLKEEKQDSVRSSDEKTEKKEVPKQEKKKPQKQINLRDLDPKKVLARLNVDNIEPEYVQFLANYFKDADLQKNNLTNEVKAVQRKLNESTQKLEKFSKEKLQFESKQKEEQSRINGLTTRVQQLTNAESELKKQISAANAANAATQHAHSVSHNEAIRLNNLLSSQQREIESLKATNQQLFKEISTQRSSQMPETELKNLKAQFNDFEKAASAVKSELEKKKKECEELKAQVEKNKDLISKFENEKRAHDDKVSTMVSEYESLQELLNGMSKEIEHFTEYRKQQEEKDKETASKVVEIPRNTTPNSEEEVFVLKKNHADLATPSHSNAEYEKVVEEKQKLEAKVEELRARNVAILEKVEEAGKKTAKSSKNEDFDVEGERKIVVQAVGKLTKKTFDKYSDSAAYSKWLQEAVSSVQKELSKPAEITKTKEVPEVKAAKTEKKAKASTTEDIEYYKSVLKSLLDEIQRIEQLCAKQAAEYEATISALRQKV